MTYLKDLAEMIPLFLITDGNGGHKVNKIRIVELVIFAVIVSAANYFMIDHLISEVVTLEERFFDHIASHPK